MNLFTTIVCLVAALNVHAITNQGTPCLEGCSKWSNTLKQCYNSFGISPHNKGYEYSNQFLRCLCEGQHPDDSTGQIVSWGNDTMAQAAGICQSCQTTPKEIKADLSTFLALCVIQKDNGTAANASTFAPLQYVTADDPNVGVSSSLHDSGVAQMAVPALASIVVATIGVAMVV